tara:strand:+ start:167 stop:346 length:180 start_codon:yes stop_codon:yes gene_type:complete
MLEDIVHQKEMLEEILVPQEAGLLVVAVEVEPVALVTKVNPQVLVSEDVVQPIVLQELQ